VKNIQINADRLWRSLMDMARLGETEKGGCCRLALTDVDREARDLFVGWGKEAGCSIRVDAMGNIFARRSGRDDSLPPVMTGSHLDTQPTGGKFDGVYGVLAGLEVLRTLDDHGFETDVPVEVAMWTNEEGSRFAPAMTGSGVFAGVFPLAEAHGLADPDGVTLGAELDRIDWKLCYLGGLRWKDDLAPEPGFRHLDRAQGITCTHAIAYGERIARATISGIPDGVYLGVRQAASSVITSSGYPAVLYYHCADCRVGACQAFCLFCKGKRKAHISFICTHAVSFRIHL